MYIVTEHNIQDIELFSKKAGSALGQPPEALHLQTALLDKDNRCCQCVWEADSIESVQGYLDPEFGAASINVYYLLDPDSAIG
ncbi:hypothetical protein [Photobacterium galatheae]|uniref:Uncharacterized protein n=1 Tax=Photobacterium galatheae TaxID=1654360 RepID=A0A066RS94_9GAMM|nr:hypothetical protein [Photobacterium galatheae]KDM90258.1 hypothetical protein EA58_18260 [Photobacterium galatheae]MCM0151480.1 hypothetical protein [Photobacterium galatheae]